MDGSTAAGLAGTGFRSAESARAQPLLRELSLDPPFSARAGFDRTTSCGSSISPPARATFRGWSSSSRAKSAQRWQIDAVDFQASTIEIARELSTEYPEIQLSLRGHSPVR